MTSRICIFGAGSIGGYVGGRLRAAGAAVSFIGRARMAQTIAVHGLHLTDYRGADLRVAPGAVEFHTEAGAAASADLVLVSVKSAATAEAAGALAEVLRPGTPVVSLQNGIGNDAILRAALPQCVVLAGMVPFNVLQRGEGAFHQGTEGELAVERHAALQPFVELFARAGLPLQQHADMPAVQWAKLLLNLNNAINALSGVPLKAELSQRDYRRVLAAAQREALGVLRRAGVSPARVTPIPTPWLPTLLSLPDGVFRVLFARMLAIDPLARSSMWEDLEAERATEVEWLNGEVVHLATKLGLSAPINARLTALVHAAEQGGRRDWSASELLAEIRRLG